MFPYSKPNYLVTKFDNSKTGVQFEKCSDILVAQKSQRKWFSHPIACFWSLFPTRLYVDNPTWTQKSMNSFLRWRWARLQEKDRKKRLKLYGPDPLNTEAKEKSVFNFNKLADEESYLLLVGLLVALGILFFGYLYG